ncbi:MAG: ABC transporter ATP-binding protein [Anaerolineales bacterium]|jgi:ABC-2 type transport system ATP-binding protein
MIVTEKLTKHYGKIKAVEDLTLHIPPGEVFGFLGPNGAGKTTTVRMLCALIGITSGQASVAGCKLGHQDQDVRRRTGILTEAPGLYDQLSAERNLGLYAHLHDVEDIAGRVERYLRMLGLWDRRNEPVGTFSKGMRQKLAIARALVHEPKVLFLDEPTSALDPEAAHLVRSFIADLKQEGRTIFMCTHNLDEADRLCDRIAIFRTRLLALDTPAALRRKLYGRTTVFHLRHATHAMISKLQALSGVHDVKSVDNRLLVTLDNPEETNPELVRTLVEAGADIQFVGELRRTLEDIYLQLVQDPEI